MFHKAMCSSILAYVMTAFTQSIQVTSRIVPIIMRGHHQYYHRSSRQQTIISISPTSLVRLTCFLITCLILSFTLYPKLSGKNGRNRSDSKLEHRLAIVIPFIGQGSDAIPSYLELFCVTAAGSADLVDFLIFHDGTFGADSDINHFSCPENVIFHSLESIEEFSHALIRVLDRKPEEELKLGGSREKLAGIVAKVIQKYPYLMVEFKPAFGHIFEKYLHGYTHWGYSDLDMMIGDLERWITPDELNHFDIVTYGFGDQHRLYLRGQFTFHRNDPAKINQLWRGCDYLSHMDKRFADVLSGDKSLRLESAEGCYSAVVLENTSIRIKYAVKAFTDVDQGNEKGARDTAYTHGVYVGIGKNKDKTVIYKAGNDHRKGLFALPYDWFETKGSVYMKRREMLYKPVGDREPILAIEKKGAKCMYWVQEKYQPRLCIDGVDSTDTIYWIHGRLYKEKYELAKLPGDILTAPFFHFQEWKRYYRTAQLGGFSRNGPYKGFVLVKDGILPIYASRNDNKIMRTRAAKDLIPSPLGQLLFRWQDVDDKNRERYPPRFYCLQAAPKERPSTTKCNFGTSWRDSRNVEILSNPDWSMVNIHSEVTMALTLQFHSDQLDSATIIEGFFRVIALYLNHWQGRPIVLMIHLAGATPSSIATIRTKFGAGSDISDFGMGSVLIGAIFSEKPDTFSRKALMNMAIDASPTRFVMSGYELERGIIPSLDTIYLAHRVAQIHKDSPGAVYVIPQFSLANGTHDFTIDGLERAKGDGRIVSISKVDDRDCEGDNSSLEYEKSGTFGMIEKLWWQLNTHDGRQNDMPIEEYALALESIQSKVATLLSEKEHYNVYATNESPILLFDNLGPFAGMITSDMVREVDEFGGKMCYNSIRLAQMATLGYRINILIGAFAISTPALRESIGDPSIGPLGVSRCDGCFFFTKEREHEDILENMSFEERQRPAKISILHSDE